MYEQPAGLKQWAEWRTITTNQLRALNEWSGLTSEIRIWPHHFDTGIYYAQNDAHGQEKTAIWAGYALADSISDEPYFYLSGYKRDEQINLLEAPPLSTGEWRQTSDWTGALLSISQVTTNEQITAFFQESYAWLQRSLSGDVHPL